MNRTMLVLTACLLLVSLLTSPATTAPPFSPFEDKNALKDGEIRVQLKGVLLLASEGVEGPQVPRKLISAAIAVPGMGVAIDWMQSEEIRDELLWWCVPRHGDTRQIYVEVTGRMVFRPEREVGGVRWEAVGIQPETRVPVVIPETLAVWLGSGGKPSGVQLRLPVQVSR